MFKRFFAALSNNQHHVHLSDGFKTEAPIVQQKREEAMAKMNQLNRLSILSGGGYSRHNTVLMGSNK